MPSAALPRSITVKESELPFACPPPNVARWNLHPRVFIPLSRAHPEKSCPYCGARYTLEAETPAGGDSA